MSDQQPKTNSNLQVTEEVSEDSTTCGFQFGCGRYASKRYPIKSLQQFATSRWALCFLGILAFMQGFTVNGHTNSVLSTLQRRFALNSFQAGLLASCYDIMSAISILFVTYIGAHSFKPQWIGRGSLLIGLGCFFFAMPHFLAPEDEMRLNLDESNFCGNQTEISCSISSLKNYRYIFYASFLLIGLGASPIYSLGITYLDENVKQRYSSMYTGILYSMAIAGPGIGFLAGSAFLKLPADIKQWFISSSLKNDQNWIGAWWIGFLISGILSVVVSVPIFMLPKTLKNGKRHRASRAQEMQANKKALEISNNQDFGKSFKDVPHSIKVLMSNPVYVFVVLSYCSDGMFINGLATFGPKYIESIFDIKPSMAGVYFGCVSIVGGVFGQLLGGGFVSKFNLGVRKMLHILYIAPIISLMCVFVFLLSCQDAYFTGINTRYTSEASISLNAACNTNCSCLKSLYQPVCGSDNSTYISPCFAGCTTLLDEKYYNCSCVSDREKFVTSGACKSDRCSNNQVILFFSCMFLLIFTTFFNHASGIQVLLRCVSFNQRSFGLGLQWFLVRLLGSIPGPLIFGALFDLACQNWSSKCEEKGFCLLYNSKKLSLYAFIFTSVVKLVNMLCGISAFVLYKPVEEVEPRKDIGTTECTKTKSSNSVLPKHISVLFTKNLDKKSSENDFHSYSNKSFREA